MKEKLIEFYKEYKATILTDQAFANVHGFSIDDLRELLNIANYYVMYEVKP